MMEETGEPRAKLLYLESLRGVAAVVVVFSHFASAFFPASSQDPFAPMHSRLEPLLHNTPLGIILAGNFAVCLFFVMSGFVLVRPFFQSRRHDLLVSASVRRYFRLMPPVAVSIFSAYLLLRLGWFTNQSQVVPTGSYWLGALWPFTAHLHDALYQAFVGAFTNPIVSYNPLLWTMWTEFFGSLLIFAIAGLTAGLSRRWVIYALLLVIFARGYFLGFIAGMIIADYMSLPGHEKSILKRLKPRALGGIMLVGLLLGAYPSDLHADVTMYSHFILPHFNPLQLISFWHTLGAILVLLSVLYWSAARRWLSHKWLVLLGRLSFSLYLSHMIILCTVGTFLFSMLHAHLGYRTSFIFTFWLTMVVILGVSILYAKLIDAPSIIWAKSVGRWLVGGEQYETNRQFSPNYMKVKSALMARFGAIFLS